MNTFIEDLMKNVDFPVFEAKYRIMIVYFLKGQNNQNNQKFFSKFFNFFVDFLFMFKYFVASYFRIQQSISEKLALIS
jgi:hypothetical protein